MIDNNAIETAFGQRLMTLSPAPKVAWPNQNFDPKAQGNLPYIAFSHFPVSRTDNTIVGTDNRQTGFFLLAVVAARGNFATAANTLAQSVAALFPQGQRLGGAVVSKPSQPEPAIEDGVYFRIPVRIDYVTEG